MSDPQNEYIRTDVLASLPLLVGLLVFVAADYRGMNLGSGILNAVVAMLVTALIATVVIIRD